MPDQTNTSSSTLTLSPQEIDLVMEHIHQQNEDASLKAIEGMVQMMRCQRSKNALLEQDVDGLHQVISGLEKKLQQAQDGEADGQICLRVRVAAMMGILRQAGITLADYDRSKIARFIALMVQSTEKQVYKILYEDKELTDAHEQDRQCVNKALSELKLPIKI